MQRGPRPSARAPSARIRRSPLQLGAARPARATASQWRRGSPVWHVFRHWPEREGGKWVGGWRRERRVTPLPCPS
jgi:hypothetical protein